MFRHNEIIILFGAGSSAEAQVPVSKQMVEKLEKLLKTDDSWSGFLEFYNLMKSAIIYSDGIRGLESDSFDIERLVNVLSELEKRENNAIYPFVGGWIPRLLEVTSYDFHKHCKNFREKILKELQQWVTLGNYQNASYYNKLFDFQDEYNYALRVFTLNYDLCIEKHVPDTKHLERGFDEKTRLWSWKPFESHSEYESNIYLYKLHGSIDWQRKDDQTKLLEVDNLPQIPDLIFGTDYKMQYIDPYLFYVYEFRKYSLESKVIITIGYSFRDQHINGIIHQAVLSDCNKKILVVSPRADRIISKITHPNDQYIAVNKNAKEFLEKFTISEIDELLKSASKTS